MRWGVLALLVVAWATACVVLPFVGGALVADGRELAGVALQAAPYWATLAALWALERLAGGA